MLKVKTSHVLNYSDLFIVTGAVSLTHNVQNRLDEILPLRYVFSRLTVKYLDSKMKQKSLPHLKQIMTFKIIIKSNIWL